MDSKIENLIRLYLKEREYQNNIFGNPGENPVLTPNSFLTFLDIYLNKFDIFDVGNKLGKNFDV